uniref:outer membrane beta-barrel protein n=1 Tax=Aquiflexum sp. TaxID=1872584 RepID=UPI00359449A3
MKYSILIILIITSIEVQAQNRLLGVKFGPSIMDISPNNFNPNKDPRSGAAVGLGYEVLLKDDFSIGAEAIYNQRGFIDNFMVVDGFGNPTGEIFSTQFN